MKALSLSFYPGHLYNNMDSFWSFFFYVNGRFSQRRIWSCENVFFIGSGPSYSKPPSQKPYTLMAFILDGKEPDMYSTYPASCPPSKRTLRSWEERQESGTELFSGEQSQMRPEVAKELPKLCISGHTHSLTHHCNNIQHIHMHAMSNTNVAPTSP